jgi:RNA polymerase sigma-70 factor (ECF subfamily)
MERPPLRDDRQAAGSTPESVPVPGSPAPSSPPIRSQGDTQPTKPPAASPPPPLELQSTFDLLARARGGDDVARDVVFRRCVKGLRRFAAGRLPLRCRGMTDTEDLVQDTVASALRRLDHFEIRHAGALLAYLRQAVLNRIIDEVRKKNRRPVAVSLPENQVDTGISPLEHVIGLQNVERYEAALRQLKLRDQEAIVLRLEQQFGYEAMAEHLGVPSPNAARVAVKRALFRLAQKMADVSAVPSAGGAGRAASNGSNGHTPTPATDPEVTA